MDSQKLHLPYNLNKIIEWALCSTYFEDIVLIALEMLNETSIDDNYKGIPLKYIKKEYINHTHYHCKTCGHKRKYITHSS